MKSFIAFLKKEVFECIRSGELTFFCILFLIFGIMNPAIAKLTPWMLETLSDSLAEQGMMVTEVTVNALTSWTQFFKNIPIALIVFVFLYSGIFATVYKGNIIKNLIMDCQSYTKYRPNETTGGIFVSWRRKEERKRLNFRHGYKNPRPHFCNRSTLIIHI